MEFAYRFRSTNALLGEHEELKNQQIYFASPEQLNDPMEGHKELQWQGDCIVWKNLLKHYLLFVVNCCYVSLIAGSDFNAEWLANSTNLVFLSTTNPPTDSLRDLHAGVCAEFFSNFQVNRLPNLLAGLGRPVRREELCFYLRGLHPRALRCAFQAVLKGRDVAISPWSTSAYEDTETNVIQKIVAALELSQISEGKLQNDAEPIFAAAENFFSQFLIMLNSLGKFPYEYMSASALLNAPESYTKSLGKLVHFDWYSACFVADPTHAAMWGNYANGHKGVCLKFHTRANSDGAARLKLRRSVGWSSGPSGTVTNYGNVDHPFYKITYADRFPALDFFHSIGRLTVPLLQNDWYCDEHGKVSLVADDIFSDETAWQGEYWKRFLTSITTKFQDWSYEEEYRLIINSILGQFQDPKDRKLTYDFKDLAGIIFGLNTTAADRTAIYGIIAQKCKECGRHDFEFGQARYSANKGKIEIQPFIFRPQDFSF